MQIPFLKPEIQKEDIYLMNRCLKSGWLAHGKYTKEFEKAISKYLKIKNVVMTSSCTAALHMSLILNNINDGDEVITTPLSYVATSNVILYQRAKPIFVDVDPKTGLIDIDKIEEKITKKTKAIIPVHLYGQMVDMKKLSKLGGKYKIVIIEDAAHAIEAKRGGYTPGSLGFSACLSFHTAKNMTSGQGGLLALNNSALVEDAYLLRRDGVKNVGSKRHMFTMGYKYDSTDFQAALLLNQLKRINDTRNKRFAIYNKYMDSFQGTNIDFPKMEKDAIHACHMFVIWVEPRRRDTIRKKLAVAGIGTSIHYEPIHLEPYYRKVFNFKRGDFPIAEKLGCSTISLPTYSTLMSREQDYIIETVKKICSR